MGEAQAVNTCVSEWFLNTAAESSTTLDAVTDETSIEADRNPAWPSSGETEQRLFVKTISISTNIMLHVG